MGIDFAMVLKDKYSLRYICKENDEVVNTKIDMCNYMCSLAEHITQFSKDRKYKMVAILSSNIQNIRKQFVDLKKKAPITSYGLVYDGCEYMLLDISTREKRDVACVQLMGVQLDCAVVNADDEMFKDGHLYYRIMGQLRNVLPLSYYEHRRKYNLVAVLSFGYMLFSAIVTALIMAWGASVFDLGIWQCFAVGVLVYTPSMLVKTAIDVINNHIWGI